MKRAIVGLTFTVLLSSPAIAAPKEPTQVQMRAFENTNASEGQACGYMVKYSNRLIDDPSDEKAFLGSAITAKDCLAAVRKETTSSAAAYFPRYVLTTTCIAFASVSVHIQSCDGVPLK